MLRIVGSAVFAVVSLLIVSSRTAIDARDDVTQKQQQRPPESVTAQDVAVIRACLEDFSAQKDVGPAGRETRLLVVDVNTNGPSWSLSNGQLSGDLDNKGWKIPVDAEYWLRRRNERLCLSETLTLRRKIKL